jgi:acylphosphatase
MTDKKAVRVIITGKVQGVFFRMETQRAAQRFRVNGWVRNKRDGTVEALFEGEPKNVDDIIDWCEGGPPMASVTDIQIHQISYSGKYVDFNVRHTS